MTAQIRTASLSEEQAAVLDALALKLGGVSKAVQHIIDVYAIEDELSTSPSAAPAEAEAVFRMIRTQQDVLRTLETYTGHDARLSAGIAALLAETPERQAPILNLVLRLARDVPRMGPLFAFEVINAVAQKSAKAETTAGKNVLPEEQPA